MAFPGVIFIRLRSVNCPSPRALGAGHAPDRQARMLLMAWAGVILAFFTLESGCGWSINSFGAWPAIAMLLGLGKRMTRESDGAWLRPFNGSWRALGGSCGVAATSSGVPCTFSGDDVSQHLEMRSPEAYLTSMVHCST